MIEYDGELRTCSDVNRQKDSELLILMNFFIKIYHRTEILELY